MIDDFEHDGTGHEELDWRLQTYASARLTASPEAVRRMRKAVVLRSADLAAIREFEAQRLAAEAERVRNSHRGLSGWLALHRRASAALLAASMTLASAAAVFGASPGSSLYPARLWIESAFLPAGADGATAHVDYLEQRVEDAEHAAGGGDPTGVAAALAAYQAEMQAAIQAAQGDPAKVAALEHALQVHLLLLQQLEQDAPSAAQNAVHDAINDARKATSDLQKGGGGKPTPAPTVAPTPAPTPEAPAQTPNARPSSGTGGGDGQNGGQNEGGN